MKLLGVMNQKLMWKLRIWLQNLWTGVMIFRTLWIKWVISGRNAHNKFFGRVSEFDRFLDSTALYVRFLNFHCWHFPFVWIE
ncbi:hypothetical protein OIU74_028438 [Salix koriyanagi]|uniref:Uncharacterized protein n=1 Tax=Salix koriyanagi TaxID=2511006 RepID=A0A9Q0ZSZ4_9ROSI|nr:hypothetical protein OIU74_028438 [Salix koriyanagi]